jgi:hypothetical protein
MDPKSGIEIMKAIQALLVTALLTSEAEWRKLQIERCLEEKLEDNVDCALCLDKVAYW